MKHPSESILALYATGDLNWVRRAMTTRHLAECGACQASTVEYSELRAGVRDFPKLPANLQWQRLAAEMSANIRLGIEAGECVSPRRQSRPPVRFGDALIWKKVGIVGAGVCAAAGFAFMLAHPPSLAGPPVTGTVLEASETGLQVSEGRHTLRLLNTSGSEVTRTVGARGEVGARYLDADGYVTVSQVYGQ
jgi:hypothetical protein